MIVDFSESGLRLRLPFAVLRGSKLEVEWDLGIASGEVRYCRRLAEGAYSVGMQVDKLIEKRPVQHARLA